MGISTPIVGFRYWLWPPLMPDLLREHFHWGKSFYLWGTIGLAPWHAVHMKASHAWSPARHVDPFEDCVCGIHAFTRWRERRRLTWFDQWPSAMLDHQMGLVGGAVVAWGRVAEHGAGQRSEGFRAEHARILALSDPMAAKLYRVPCVAEGNLELYASEFGVRLDELHQ